METVIEIEGVNGDYVVLSGPQVGRDGMWLASGLEGFFDPEVSTTTRSPANRPGTRLISHRILERTITFKVTIANDSGPGRSWEDRDARWRRLWSWDQYTSIRAVSAGGERTLKARLQEIEVDTRFDPHTNSATDVIMTVVADDPFWYGPTELLEGVVPANGSLTLTSLMANPTSNRIYPEWVLEAPGTWTVPDWSPANPSKTITLPPALPGSHLLVSSDPASRQLLSSNRDPIWQRMNGVRFRNHIPAYTGEVRFRVSVQSGGARQVQLRLNRPFDRPWGA